MAVPKDARAIRTSELCKRRRGRRRVTHINGSKTVLCLFAISTQTRVTGLILQLLPANTRVRGQLKTEPRACGTKVVGATHGTRAAQVKLPFSFKNLVPPRA